MEPEKPLTKKQRKALAKEEKRKESEMNEFFGKARKWIIGLLVVGVIVFGAAKFWQWINTPTVPQGDLLSVKATDHIKGNPDAKTTLIEYADYECPACAVYSGYVNRLVEEDGSSFRLVFRNFPLIQIHRTSVQAAKSAESAGLQGKFWEMHDMLFAKQDDWVKESNPMDKFVSYATELELNIDQFNTEYNSSQVEDKVNADLTSANQLRLNSTPTFFLDGKKVNVPANYDDFKSIVDQAIQNNQ